MKNVYFVQVDVAATLGARNAYLPYTAGILAASVWRSETVRRNCEFKEFIFLRENTETVLRRMDRPFLVAFTNYCWNTEYNKLLAAGIKEKWPECVIVFGGHNIPDDFSFLEEYPYIDVLCHGEGEDVLRDLFDALLIGLPLGGVANISYRDPGKGPVRTAYACPGPIESFPSPYLDGWFDSILEQHPDITFNAILETSRGCPNRCAYCDWGLLQSKVRQFPIERVKAEIRWFGEHKIAFVWGADANFGMFRRDLELADELVKTKKATGYPEKMRVNYAKNNFENVFAIVKKFKECEFDRIGATLSFQSLSPVVLKNIGRTNADIEFYKNLLTKYNTEKMKTYSELILGLPGETYESFISGIGKLFGIGQHFVFEVYACIVLPNAHLGRPEVIEKYGIKTVRTEIVRPHFEDEEFNVPEYNTIITETADMPRDKWIRANVFFSVAKAFHGNGLLRAFAVYLYYHKGIPYERFYDGIIDYCEKRPGLVLAKVIEEVRKDALQQSVGGSKYKLQVKQTGDVIWNPHEYIVLNLLEDIDGFYLEIRPYLESFCIEKDVFGDLLAYQESILRKPREEERTVDLDYDVHGFLTDVYVNNVHPLKKKRHRLVMRDTAPSPDWKHFGKYVIWYGHMGWASYKDDITVTDP